MAQQLTAIQRLWLQKVLSGEKTIDEVPAKIRVAIESYIPAED